jgi:hypothetical protein
METKNNHYNSPIWLLSLILEMKNFLLCTCALQGIMLIAEQCQTNPLPAVPDGPWCLNANAGLRQLTTIRNASSPEFQHLPHLIFQHLIFQFTVARITPAVLWTFRVSFEGAVGIFFPPSTPPIWTCMVYPFPPLAVMSCSQQYRCRCEGCICFHNQQYGRLGCVHFHTQKYGCAWCIHFHSQAVWGVPSRVGCIPFHHQQ